MYLPVANTTYTPNDSEMSSIRYNYDLCRVRINTNVPKKKPYPIVEVIHAGQNAFLYGDAGFISWLSIANPWTFAFGGGGFSWNGIRRAAGSFRNTFRRGINRFTRFNGHHRNQAFSGVTDLHTGKAYLKPSLNIPRPRPIPRGYVRARGGHRTIVEEIVGGRMPYREGFRTQRFVAFTLKKNLGKQVEIFSWTSRGVNGHYHGNARIAAEYVDEIAESLYNKYGVETIVNITR